MASTGVPNKTADRSTHCYLFDKLKMAELSPAIFLKPDITSPALYPNISAVIPLYQPILSHRFSSLKPHLHPFC